MTDIIRQIKNQIEDVTKKALADMDIQGKDSYGFKAALEGEIEIEIPKEKAHGDFSINTAILYSLGFPDGSVVKNLFQF